MKKKIFVSSILVILILSVCLAMFAGCNSGYVIVKATDFDIPDTKFGESKLENSTPVTADMSAYDMLNVAMENFYNAEYAVVNYQGGVRMKILGTIKVDQEVQSLKIRDGKGDITGKNVNKATYFADNKSYSNMANLYEKMVFGSDGSIQWRNASGTKWEKANPKKNKPEKWTVEKWNAIDSDFTSIANEGEEKSFLAKNNNNPTIIWMYDLSKENILETFEPKYDETTKTYRFSLKFKPVESTVEYVKTMKSQLENNGGIKVGDLQFKQLVINVVLWEDGTFRTLYVDETYSMTMTPVKGINLKNTIVRLTATQSFSYDPNEEGYDIQTYIDNFTNEKDLVA